MPDDDLIARYLRLPADMRMLDAARRLGVAVSTLENARRAAGLTKPSRAADPAADLALATAYKALPKMGLETAARRLGVGAGRLVGALIRTGHAARRPPPPAPAASPKAEPGTPRVASTALPPGAVESWEVLTWMTGRPVPPWPAVVRSLAR